MFLLIKILSTGGLSAPGLYTFIKSWKDVFNWQVEVMRPFSWHHNFVPNELSAPTENTYMYKIMKKKIMKKKKKKKNHEKKKKKKKNHEKKKKKKKKKNCA